MRFCILGAGHDVSLVARGPRAQSLAEHGLVLLEREVEYRAAPSALLDRLDWVESYDFVLVCLKAHQIEECTEELARAQASGACIVGFQNVFKVS